MPSARIRSATSHRPRLAVLASTFGMASAPRLLVVAVMLVMLHRVAPGTLRSGARLARLSRRVLERRSMSAQTRHVTQVDAFELCHTLACFLRGAVCEFDLHIILTPIKSRVPL